MGQLWRFNNTLYEDKYLLDVNPNSRLRTYQDSENVIDARFIDIKTGSYMDITALTNQGQDIDLETTNILSCKSPHWYSFDDMFPLVASSFNDVNVYRPSNPVPILAQEYGEKGMSNKNFVVGGRKYKYTLDSGWVKQ